jgi:hypothetical protein
MSSTGLYTLSTCGLLALTASGTLASNPPDITRVSMDAGRVRLVDARDNKSIIVPTQTALHDYLPRKQIPLVPSVELIDEHNGFNLVYTFRNTTTEVQPLGTIRIGGLNLGKNISYRNFDQTGQLEQAAHNTWGQKTWAYPQDFYSPVVVLENAKYVISASIHYPILDLKHDVRVGFKAYSGPAPASGEKDLWELELKLSEPFIGKGRERVPNPATLKPGESRSYTVAVRVTDRKDRWMETLVPYRDFFHGLYGGVDYERETAMIKPVSIAAEPNITNDNPKGFSRRYRPDLVGWDPVIQDILSTEGFDDFVLWCPTGVFKKNRQYNFPFQFTSSWAADNKLATATDRRIGLPRVPSGGKDLGFWWGRSTQVMSGWDNGVAATLNPKNSGHRAAAFAEMDKALAAGATIIGLDLFHTSVMPLWDLAPWLQTLESRYPSVRFVTEPRSCDVLHNISPTYYRGHNDRFRPSSADKIDVIRTPMFLADFLNPGHETWGAFRYGGYMHFFGQTITDDRVQADMNRIASMGYVPVFFHSTTPARPYQAAESWLTTVPADLRLPRD